MKQTVIAIVGPTAIGKTKLSIEVAKKFNGEIISGDSMQVYKNMDIGTAKVTKEEMQGISHYMIDTKEPSEAYSVADFQRDVQASIKKIASHQKIPIIVGGSGLYIQAALYNYNFSNHKRDQQITEQLEKYVNKEGINPLFERLKEIDPEQAAKIHPNNHRRVIRALEIYETTGTTMTAYQQNQNSESPYKVLFIGLEMDRSLLYNRINKRIDLMMEKGLLKEVKSLYEQGLENCQSMKAIGYKEFLPYFKGEQDLDRAIELLKRNSRRYAKRQYTWFKNKMDIHWYTIAACSIDESFQTILKDLAGLLKEK
ncbi:tRNA (adenosine(37)-N6)-dimethylallyltransferase MiaA [Virgibacillus alimentarius]|uniref:tRNA (adenosine(37)-N6)-dimethylallyltransferase MiaA n=1 Tax=Virgibacillus alimentarius TaxID=698769 RepID=UPI000493A956|nr:tRNA (adenosine(37)-N6)-dimethylallyltransferase MiaA [Virgibacillus alimentarius]